MVVAPLVTPQQEWRSRTRRRSRRRRLGRRWRYRRQWWWRPRETVFTQEYIEEPDIERGQSDTISVKEELRECFGKFGEIGDVYMDGKKISGSGSQVPMSTQANVGDWDAVLLPPPWAPMEFDGFLRDYASGGRQSRGRPA